jgi:hypothetical protein
MSGKDVLLGWMEVLQGVRPRGGASAWETNMAVIPQERAHITLSFGEQNPHVSYELERATPKVKVWCGVTRDKVYGSFIFAEETVCATSYLDML